MTAAEAAERTAAAQVQAEAGHLCTRCHGTGIYQGPSRIRLSGKAYCFACAGDGLSRAGRVVGAPSAARYVEVSS